MARDIFTNYDFNGVSRIVNLPPAIEDTEPVTLAQFKAYQESTSLIDDSNAIDGSIPIYSLEDGKFFANQLNTKLTITDGGNF